MKKIQKTTKATQQRCTDVIKSMSVHLDQIERLIDVTFACKHGLYILTNAEKSARARVNALEVLIKASDPSSASEKITDYKRQLEFADKEIENAKNIEKIAQKEKESDYALLFSFALISLWSILESMAKEFLAAWIKANPKLLKAEKIANIKITLGDYEPLSQLDKIKHILFLLDRNFGGDNRSGINRFENLFSLFELNGKLPKQLKDHMYEFQQVRNSLAHDGFISGKQLKAACPWLFKNSRQKTLTVTADMFMKYIMATIYYCGLVKWRAVEWTGIDKTTVIKDIFKVYDEEYSKD